MAGAGYLALLAATTPTALDQIIQGCNQDQWVVKTVGVDDMDAWQQRHASEEPSFLGPDRLKALMDALEMDPS